MNAEPYVGFIYELGNCPFIEVPEGMTRIFPYEDEETEEKSNILTELETVNKENRKLKIGIINFVKGFGG